MSDDAIVEAWTTHQHARSLSRATISRRHYSLRMWRRYLAPLELGDATPELVEAWLAGHQHPATKRAYLADLRVFYRWAKSRRVVAADPTASVGRVRVPRPLPRPVPLEDVERLLQVALDDDRTAVLLGAYAGLRVSEMARLSTEDIRWHPACSVLVVRGGKGGRDRAVPLHPLVATALRHSRLPLWGGVTPGSVTRRLRRVMADAGVPGTPHALRHTFGSRLAEGHADLLVIGALMGHASPTTTRGYVALSGVVGELEVGAL